MSSMLNTAIRLLETTPVRWTPVGSMNALFDCIFYDQKEVTVKDWVDSWWWLDPEGPLMYPEGAIVVVSPRTINRPSEIFDLRDDHAIDSVLTYLEQSKAHTVTVSGCGSSYIGSVAFGRMVANALNGPVATVVAGYGLRDAATEIAAGLWSASANWTVNAADFWLNRFFGEGFPRPVRNEIYDIVDVSPEASSLSRLLVANRGQIKRIVGHSKGIYAVAAALFGLKASIQNDPAAEIDTKTDIDVFTFGCWMELPHDESGKPFGKLRYHQYVGQFDPFQFNSPPPKLFEMHARMWNGTADPDERIVPFARHDLIPWLPGHMPIETLLH